MNKIVIASIIGAAAAVAACTKPPPDIAFGADKIDFARLEHTLPLSDADRAKLTPDNIDQLSQEQVDQIYARLTAGPIPNGPFDGQLFFPRGANRSRFAEVVGGGKDGGFRTRAAELGVLKLDVIGERLWRGKVFNRETRILRNRMTDILALQVILDETEEAQLEKLKDPELGQYLLFPAKLYCGQSMLDGRRESIIIDYAYTDDLPGYLESLDHLVGREGLRVRDEIRMVRPGFYLGRAYMDRFFVVNFTLHDGKSAGAAAAAAEDCFTGEQARVAAR
jgi:hypothetical protein